MAISDPLVLSDNVVLLPAESLPPYLHAYMQYTTGDYIITRPQSRTASRIIDAQTTEFLKLFQTPTTIVQAVIQFSSLHTLDPEQVLTDIFPILQGLMDAAFLVAASAAQTQQIRPSLSAGTQIANYTILNCVHIVEDTEIYQATHCNGETVAVKISRPGCSRAALRMFEQEAAILQRLDNVVNPALLDTGLFEDRHYLVIEWCAGVDVSVAMAALRYQQRNESRKQMLLCCTAILDAYAHLHAQNILHADIHPGNILLTSDGSIKIIDYGFAYQTDKTATETTMQRADISYFSEPEYAQAVLTGLSIPEPGLKGEQFSLAALLYFLLTGAHYLKFSLERSTVLQNIVADRPLRFSAWGIQPWFAVEALLATALHKDPTQRFPSVADFSRRLHEAIVLDDRPGSASTQHSTQAFLRSVLQHLGLDGPLLSTGLSAAPTCSLSVGAAGIAYAIYRIACIQDSPALLSLADIWSAQALNAMKNGDAFYNGTNITAASVGQTSPYHTSSGVYCTQAFISHALGDFASLQEAIDAFATASQAPCTSIDLLTGRSGTLLASSFLLDKALQAPIVNTAPLLSLGSEILQGIWDEIGGLPAISECSAFPSLGIAHGWAGLLYATLSWCQSSHTRYPDMVEARLQQLAACAESHGRGVHWNLAIPQLGQKHANTSLPNWCNGSAGYVYLWTLAHQLFGDEMYGRLAEQAAWHTWETQNSLGFLCCGLAGQAYSLLNLYKHTGENFWLTCAHTLAERAVLTAQDFVPDNTALHIGSEPRSESLYYGNTGIAVLVADLSRPEEASMPFFEREC